ncbi:uncharacterized protein LOC119562391 isoform X1 [Drosophila subpulchrella]|uniref:uncharacterized protein LOC119562391 isoform X1 n=1 Tax=Drosophila subpulchrella TaxID=1486046 RepID=UPI0018A1A98D|nr:uncharacterized protein LOC119562391 isoform X1 [Drosophila subpulchrella]XP_037731512.1 uncharacterized protein LOC119562391 isoform X1 [Drosophila subpulchrella]XP_037731513.1 uncharacterized protein LOC119562391 isoform X1 [Drosophila subpulchrella]
MTTGTSPHISTSCRTYPRRERSRTTGTISDELSTGGPQDSTSTSYLAAKAEMEDALASIGRRKKKAPAKGQLEKPLPGCWATSCSIRRNNHVPSPTPTSFRSNMLSAFGAGLQMARHP